MPKYVSVKFSGYIGLVDAPNSWIARMINRKDAPPGMYAASIEDTDVDHGEIEDEDEDDDDMDDATEPK